jgi:sialate O-acetylesterase
MRSASSRTIVFGLGILLLTLRTANAEIRLPALISDHAMLQAGKPVAIWGWSAPGAKVHVSFTATGARYQNDFTAVADASGRWSGVLRPLLSGTVGQLEIESDKDASKTVSDLLAGEVWLGGGQSNMVYTIAGNSGKDPTNPVEMAEIARNIADAQKEAGIIKGSIRYFKVTSSGADEPADDVTGQWVLASPGNVKDFSAVAWNFAVALQDKLHQPVGLIVSCVGGTPVESWMSRQTLESTSAGAAVEGRHNARVAASTPEVIARQEAAMKAWQAANPTPELKFLHESTRQRPAYTATYYTAPVRLYNGMIHGLEPYTLRGVIWFQADGNASFPLEYSEMFQAMIREWRADWKEQLPFYFVEMNNARTPQTKPVEQCNLCLIREQQHGALQLPGVGMIAAIDVGNGNLHFPNKRPLGQRLAGLALHNVYGMPGQPNSPIFRSFKIEGNKVRLSFDDAAGLRTTTGGELKGFAIRGSSGDWVWAQGKIEGEQIVVWNDAVRSPVAVRYAWAQNPVISVENGVGLPLYPFRTDRESKQ